MKPEKRGQFLNCFLILLIFIAAFLIRFYRFPYRINFGPEQADSLITAAKNIKEKPSLLGQSYFARSTSKGHQLFASPLFSYSLMPLLVVFKNDPLPITAYFAILNLATGMALFLIAKKIFSGPVALLSAFLFLFNARMVYHSMFIWILNYLPLIGLMLFFLLYCYSKKQDHFIVFLVGTLSGIGLGLEYLFLPVIFLIIFLLIEAPRLNPPAGGPRILSFINEPLSSFKAEIRPEPRSARRRRMKFSKQKFQDLSLFLFGLLIINLPTIIFDLKHDFYHLRTLFQYLLDTLANPNQSRISSYHFLYLWPLAALVTGKLLYYLFQKSKILLTMVLLAYLFFNFRSPLISFSKATGMAGDFSYPQLLRAAELIAKENPENFNLVSLVPSDTFRAYPWRYLLTYRFDLKPEGIEDYTKINFLYLIVPSGSDPLHSQVWEVHASGLGKITLLQCLGENYCLYRTSGN